MGTGAGAAAGVEAATVAAAAADATATGAIASDEAVAVGADAAGAVAADAAMEGSSAMALTLPSSKPKPKVRDASNFFMVMISSCFVMRRGLECFVAGFTGANADDLFERIDKYFAIANLAGAGSTLNGFDDAFDKLVRHGSFDLDLGQKVNNVFGPTLKLGVAFLTTKAFDFGHGNAWYADGR